ncbi:MAG: sigma 54-interacting transcriptional regulator, partial [Methylocystis sp.]
MGYEPDSIIKATAKPNALTESALVSLYEISKLLATPNRIEKTLSGVATLLASFLQLRHGLITLLDSEGEPVTVVGAGWSEATRARFAAHLPRPVVCQIFNTGMPVMIENVLDSPLFSQCDLSAIGASKERPLSMIGVPIKDAERVIGSLTVDRELDLQAAFHFDRDIRLLVMVAALIGQTLRLHRYVAEERARLMLEQARIAKTAPAEKSERTMKRAAEPSLPGILGESAAIRAAIEKVRVVAKARSTVILRGETGVGKEAFAAAIHRLSPRRERPFVKLNCAVLSESVLESELFGHERGAFT